MKDKMISMWQKAKAWVDGVAADKQKVLIGTSIVVGILFVLFVITKVSPSSLHGEKNDTQMATVASFDVDAHIPDWAKNTESASATDTNNVCAQNVSALITSMKSEVSTPAAEFSDYTLDTVYVGDMALIGKASDRTAKAFITNLNKELVKAEVNFGGEYSLVQLSIKKFGSVYWIVNRKTGASYPVPYELTNIQVKPNSNLIVINDPESVITEMSQMSGIEMACKNNFTDKKTSYIVWNETSHAFDTIGTETPKTQSFWKYWFK